MSEIHSEGDMELSDHAKEVGRRVLSEYLKAEHAATSGLPPAQVLIPGWPIVPFPITLELLEEWRRLDAIAEDAKARWRAWMSDPEGYSSSVSE
jgi:hypothetical protein